MYRHWNRNSILFELKGLAREREPLNSGAIQKEDPGLHAAAVRHFGSYDAALRAAKLEPGDHRRRRRWTKELVLKELKLLYRRSKRPTTESLRSKHSALYGAASRFFGGIPAAMKAAGLKK